MGKRVTIDPIPDAQEPIADLLAAHERRFAREAKRRKAERWLPISIDESQPFGIMFFGDPHLDDDNCDMARLRADIAITKQPGIYAACVGDKTNNWVGRLVRLYSDQHTTKSDARRLARWYLRDAGIPWLFHVLGNHDGWSEGDAILSLINDGAYYFADWDARVEIRAGGARFRIHAAHDFKGSSIWNKTHGPARAAMMSGQAELYVCGHRHTYGSQSFELEDTGRLVHAIRTRGYKAHDHYAVVNGFSQGEAGASVFGLFDPCAQTQAGRITTFADPELGARVLAGLRRAPTKRTKRNGAR